jgi:outer membrane protein assembly factor BamB
VASGIVYVGSESGSLFALHAASGQELWRYQTGVSIGSSPAIGQGIVVIGCSDGRLYAFSP